MADTLDSATHTERIFLEETLLKPAHVMRSRADAIANQRARFSADAMRHEYRRLSTLFAVRISCFERKQFVNLSNAPGKAMNLNSYLGLIARNFRLVTKSDGLHLEECEASSVQLRMADAKYIIAVDADTLLVHDYALRLIEFMEQEENRRVAIAQSPHRPFPGSSVELERVVGMQTDIQRMLCQGSAYYGAAFWVGGSALMRREALEDVCESTSERGYLIRKFIQDRTLVEDTESSLGFLARGWRIYNYLDPLTYSMVPENFGALIVQRRRWSGGGLLNLPALVKYLRSVEHPWRKIPEALLRFHYLASTTVNLRMLFMPLIATRDSSSSGWLLLTTPIYYVLYTRDLLACGYSLMDLPRIYALNLLLVPVSINGVFSSLGQWRTGRKPFFQRTPKIRDRTAVPIPYLIALWSIPPATFLVAIIDLISGGISMAALGLLNAALLTIAVVRFVGVRDSLEDAGAQLFGDRKRASLSRTSPVMR